MYPSTAEMFVELSAKHRLGGLFGAIGRHTPLHGITYGFLREMDRRFPGVLKIAPDAPDSMAVADDKEFFRILGYAGAESIDCSTSEGAEHIVDLNDTNLDEALVGRFDVIDNNGTLEHIFHVPNCLLNITRMLKIGGHVIHGVPMNNWVDHGFYQISPTLLFDYYLDNQFIVKEGRIFMYIFGLSYSTLDIRYITVDGSAFYCPSLHPDHILPGVFDGGMYGFLFVAQKVAESTTDVVPMQTLYATAEKRKERLERILKQMKVAEIKSSASLEMAGDILEKRAGPYQTD